MDDVNSSGTLSVGVVVVASQGCEHARAVISAVRSQLWEGDELVVIESAPCVGAAGSGLQRERHVTVATHDDAEMRLLGFDELRSEVLLALEDHGVPDPGFLTSLHTLFDARPGLEACTFFLRNGTQVDLPSRAVFAFVAGFADADSAIAVPRPVCSSFAIRRATIERVASQAGAKAIPCNVLEYEVIPSLANSGVDRLPRDLTLTHFQVNSAREALTAVFWNGRIAGWAESQRGLPAARPVVVSKRYLGRAVRLNRVRRRTTGELALLSLLGAVGFVGWWTGRALGPGRADDMLRGVHPRPAP